jgi:hypothetical protein
MAYAARSGTVFIAGMFLVASLGAAARAQSSQYPKPTELPNPYRLVEGWPTLPESTNGGRWGEVVPGARPLIVRANSRESLTSVPLTAVMTSRGSGHRNCPRSRERRSE